VCIWSAINRGSSVARLVIPDRFQRHCDYAGSDLASVYLSLAGRTGHPLPQRNVWAGPMPRFQTKEAGDRWTELTAIACWLLYLARPIVEDTPASLAKAAAAFDAPTGSAGHLPDSCATWQSSSPNPKSVEKRPDGRTADKERRNNAMLWSKRRLQRRKWLEARLVKC